MLCHWLSLFWPTMCSCRVPSCLCSYPRHFLYSLVSLLLVLATLFIPCRLVPHCQIVILHVVMRPVWRDQRPADSPQLTPNIWRSGGHGNLFWCPTRSTSPDDGSTLPSSPGVPGLAADSGCQSRSSRRISANASWLHLFDLSREKALEACLYGQVGHFVDVCPVKDSTRQK